MILYHFIFLDSRPRRARFFDSSVTGFGEVSLIGQNLKVLSDFWRVYFKLSKNLNLIVQIFIRLGKFSGINLFLANLQRQSGHTVWLLRLEK